MSVNEQFYNHLSIPTKDEVESMIGTPTQEELEDAIIDVTIPATQEETLESSTFIYY